MRQKHVVQTDFRKDQQRPAKVKESFTIDYPQEGETVAGRDYTFRINAPQDAPTVELSINQGPWLPCRPAIGYWWYDWICDGGKEHTVTARVFGDHLADDRGVFTVLMAFHAVQNGGGTLGR